MTEVVKAARPSKPRRMSAGELARKMRTVGGKVITTAPPGRRGLGGGWPDRSPRGLGGDTDRRGPIPAGPEAGGHDEPRRARGLGAGRERAGMRADRPGSREGPGTCGLRAGD